MRAPPEVAVPEKVSPVPPLQQLEALLAHPVTLTFATIVAAWLAARVVEEQVRRLRLDGEDRAGARRFDWPALYSTLVFWFVLGLGLFGVAGHLQLRPIATLLEGACGVLLRLLLAATVLVGASRLGAALTDATPGEGDEALAAKRRERRAVLVVGATLAAAAATGLSVGTCVAFALVAGPAAFLLRHPEHRARLAGWLADLAAGLRLRELPPDRHRVEGLQVAGKIGLISTWVEEGNGRRLVRNEALLERLTG